MDPLKIPIRASTQEHLEIEDIIDDLVILKDGGAVLVITTTAINFGLLSEKEQDAIIYAYAGLINSLTYSLQIVIRSQKKNVASYLKLLDQAEQKAPEEKIKDQIRKYKTFIAEIVSKNEVLDKKFYLAIPMTAIEVGARKAFASSIKRTKTLPFPKDYILEKAKVNLLPKRDHLLKQLARLGLKARQLTTAELIQFYFEVYNPDIRTLPTTQIADYQTPFVQPGVRPTETESDSVTAKPDTNATTTDTVEAKSDLTDTPPHQPPVDQPVNPQSASSPTAAPGVREEIQELVTTANQS